jgi:hypothetical protein
MSNNFDLRKFLTENKLTSVAKNINEWEDKSVKDYANAMSTAFGNKPKEKESEKTVKESEGYIEVMGDDFDEAVDQIVFAWEQWKNGPATEPEDIEPARQDVVDYIKSLLK